MHVLIVCALAFAAALQIGGALGLLDSTIRVTAAASKSPDARGAEVWVRVADEFGVDRTFDATPMGPGWTHKNGWYLHAGAQESMLEIRLPAPSSVRLAFVAHPWSGRVAIQAATFATERELFRPVEGIEQVRVDLPFERSAQRRVLVLTVLCAVPIGVLVRRARRGASLATGCSVRTGLVAAAVALLLMITLPMPPFAATAVSGWVVAKTVSTAWALGLLLVLAVQATARRRLASTGVRRDRLIAVCAGGLLVWLAAHWLVFYPAPMSIDSINAWREILVAQGFSDAPALHTLYLAALRRVWSTPAAAAAVQIAALVGLYWAFMRTLARLGAGTAVIVATAVALAAQPVIAFTTITVWRDVTYALCLAAVTLLLLRVYVSEGRSLASPGFCAGLALLLAAVTLFRFNGALVSIGVPVLLFAFYRNRRRAAALVLLGALAAIGAGKVIVYPALDVRPSELTAVAAAHHLAAHLKAGTPLRPEERQFLEQIRPTHDAWDYDCSAVNPTVFASPFNMAAAIRESKQMVRLAAALVVRDPAVEVRHVVCVSNLVWMIDRLPGFRQYVFALGQSDGRMHYIVSNPLVAEQSFAPQLVQRYGSFLVDIESPWLVRPAAYLWVFVLCMTVALLRGAPRSLLVVSAPLMLTSLSVALTTIAQDVRYQFPVFLLAVLMGPWLLVAAAATRAMSAQPDPGRAVRASSSIA